MTLNYNNPNDWGKSPLTDKALRLQQFRAENPEKWDEQEAYPPFTGQEFIDNHDTIDEHPYSCAFGQFLGNGIPADAANELAFGLNSLHLISDDYEDPVRVRAHNIFEQFNDMGYWRDSGETDSEPENFTFE